MNQILTQALRRSVLVLLLVVQPVIDFNRVADIALLLTSLDLSCQLLPVLRRARCLEQLLRLAIVVDEALHDGGVRAFQIIVTVRYLEPRAQQQIHQAAR